ncbi:MAG: hypothetical protein Q9169_004876 [Polycauliona sp. 2 TL-2023]
MSIPPTPTLILLNLPASILCGINLLTFTTTPTFLGIKNLPTGFHFLFTSPSASLSLRDGFWFHIPPPPSSPHAPTTSLFRKWSPGDERLIPCSNSEGKAFIEARGGWQQVYEKNLTPYRQSAGAAPSKKDTAATSPQEDKEGAWENITSHITPAGLTRFTKSEEDWTIPSASSGVQDRDEIPGLDSEEVLDVIGEEKELGMLGIDLKRTWREGAVGRERTEGARDRSWLLKDLCERHQNMGGAGNEVLKRQDDGGEERWGDMILGQMEICFLMVLTLANYSCLEEWKRILALVLTCEKALLDTPYIFERFLQLLKMQLERTDDVEGGLFDMSDDGGAFLKALLKGFKRILGQIAESKSEEDGIDDVMDEFKEVEEWVRDHYRWELGDEFARSGMLELEDGEMVMMETKELEGEDESGEYAPVVVDT